MCSVSEGECETCGHWSSQLVDVMCGECREKYLVESESEDDKENDQQD